MDGWKNQGEKSRLIIDDKTRSPWFYFSSLENFIYSMKKKYILAVTAIVVFAAITATVKVLKEMEGKPEVKEKEEKDNDDRITPEKLQELKEKFGAK